MGACSLVSAPPQTREDVPCPVCGGEGTTAFSQRDLYVGVDGEFSQRHCSSCNVYFQSPRVRESDIAAFYSDSYEPYNGVAYHSVVVKAAAAIGLTTRRRRLVERFVRGGRILDVGCGTGYFLDTLRGGNWTRCAMDLKFHGKYEWPDEVYESRFDAPALPAIGHLNAITLWHVFEHLYHPHVALDNASTLLKPGGFLFLAIPDLVCLERFLFGRYWAGWDLPRHLATYSASSMETLLQRSGLRLVKVVPDACTGDFAALNVELLLRSKGIWRNVHRSLILRAILSPFVFASIRLGLAPSKVYVAQKPA